MADDVVGDVAVVDPRLEDLDLLARDLGPADSADQLFALAAEHAAGDDLHPAGAQAWGLMHGRAALLHALDVGPARGVDPDPLAFRDERGHLDDEARLHLGRLAHVRDRPALDGRLRLHDRHVYRLRELDPDRAALVHLDLELDVRDQVGHGVAEHLAREPDLLEALVVHEVIHVAVLVEELHLGLVQDRALHHVYGPETVLADRTVLQVADLGLNQPAQVARGFVLGLHDPVKVVLVLDAHSALELGGLNHECALFPSGKPRLYPTRPPGPSDRLGTAPT